MRSFEQWTGGAPKTSYDVTARHISQLSVDTQMQTLLRASVPFGRCSLLSYRKYSTQPASILKPPPAPNTNARTLAKELSGKNLINGELQSSAHLNTLKISHPATGEVFGHVPRGNNIY